MSGPDSEITNQTRLENAELIDQVLRSTRESHHFTCDSEGRHFLHP